MTAVSHTHTDHCGHAEGRERDSAGSVRASAPECRILLGAEAEYRPMVFPRLPDQLTEIPSAV